jgi:glyoxylase-like metal-dependent hydrolase (beta-lactamase superfamily II)
MRLIRFQPVEPDIVLEGEAEIAGLKAIPAPGHTPGSICYYQPNFAIFVGDVLGSDSRGNPKPRPTRFSGNASQARTSILTVSSLEYGILLPGHGAPVLPHASYKVKQMLKRLP